MKALFALLFTVAIQAAPPVITELNPRGAERGRPFTLTIMGKDLPDGAKVWSTMPATFTAVSGEKGSKFLVEPKDDIAPGIYPVRLETPAGLSNILFFSVGTFPELTEQESLPYSEPNRNDTIENSEPVQTTPVTLNGTLEGAERDVYRVSGKMGETRIFEVEARRTGSAIDPVLRILDGKGNQLARSDDAAGAGLDPRIEFKFPKEGYYYVEVRDSRYSKQEQNFYRLKMGSYSFADAIFPLGGQRGTTAAVTYSGGNLTAPVKATLDLPKTSEYTMAALPKSQAMPLLFAVSDMTEVIEPSAAVEAPVVINGRLDKPGEVDKFKIKAAPGENLLFEVQARDLGTSKIEAVITARDASGKKLDSAGDKPLPEDVFAVQGTSRTSSDPFLNVKVPEGSSEVTLSIEDIALRGGSHFAYRISVRKQAQDFRLSIATPFVNVPKGGTAVVNVIADRRGYDGPIQLGVEDLPKGIKVEGGYIPRETMDANNQRSANRRGVLVLSAEPNTEMPPRELIVIGAGKLDDGTVLKRQARGSGMSGEVTGATAQGVVDRQRALTAPWLGLDLPASSAEPQIATLEVKPWKFTRKEEGDTFDYVYVWEKPDGVGTPATLNVEVIGARETRVINFERIPFGGTFTINTTKSTEPGTYDVIVRGRMGTGMNAQDIYARPIQMVVKERKENAQTASAQ